MLPNRDLKENQHEPTRSQKGAKENKKEAKTCQKRIRKKKRFGALQKVRTPSRAETSVAYKTDGTSNILSAPRTRTFEIP